MCECFVRITDVRKVDFGFYGNECEYDVEVFNSKRKKIGQIENIKVVQQGTDYESVYEELNDLCEEGDREAIAERLGVEEVSDEWFDEDGLIDADKLPESVNDYICEGYDQTLLDYYMSEDLVDDEDEEGLIPLEAFVDRLTFGHVGYFREIDIDLPLEDMFDKVGGWYEPDVWSPEENFVPFDVTTSDGQSLFAKLAAIVKCHLENYDYVSSLVEIRYDGDYNMEDKARKYMNYTCVEIAYIILRSLLPQIDECSAEGWKTTLNKAITNIGKRIGFIYSDDRPVHDCLCDEVYSALKDDQWPSSGLDVFGQLVSAFLKQKVYPMTDEKYTELKEDRHLNFLNYCIG